MKVLTLASLTVVHLHLVIMSECKCISMYVYCVCMHVCVCLCVCACVLLCKVVTYGAAGAAGTAMTTPLLSLHNNTLIKATMLISQKQS